LNTKEIADVEPCKYSNIHGSHKKCVFDKLVVPTVFTALLCIIIQKALYGYYATANILRKQRKEVLNWDALLR